MLSTLPPVQPAAARRLTEADAIDIWIARWLRIRCKDLIARYGCDPRRLYEIWEGMRFPASRHARGAVSPAEALALFAAQHPGLAERIDFGLHRRIPRSPVMEVSLSCSNCTGHQNGSRTWRWTASSESRMFLLCSRVSRSQPTAPSTRCTRHSPCAPI